VNGYGGFADKRIKRLETGKTFIIDDRSPSDEGADGLYSYFCTVFATVIGDDEVEVHLYGNVPVNAAVEAWFSKHGTLDGRSGKFTVNSANAGLPGDLAKAMRGITAPGTKYTVASYKYVVPRTVGTLERLGALLESYAGSKGA